MTWSLPIQSSPKLCRVNPYWGMIFRSDILQMLYNIKINEIASDSTAINITKVIAECKIWIIKPYQITCIDVIPDITHHKVLDGQIH